MLRSEGLDFPVSFTGEANSLFACVLNKAAKSTCLNPLFVLLYKIISYSIAYVQVTSCLHSNHKTEFYKFRNLHCEKLIKVLLCLLL